MNVITLEDGKKYYEIAKMNLNNNVYLVLSCKDGDKMVVRKLSVSSTTGKTIMEKLDDVNELNLVVDEFIKQFH